MGWGRVGGGGGGHVAGSALPASRDAARTSAAASQISMNGPHSAASAPARPSQPRLMASETALSQMSQPRPVTCRVVMVGGDCV